MWMIDFTENHAVEVTFYSIRPDGSDSLIRNWALQGSNDSNTWIDLSVHINDSSVGTRGKIAAFPVLSREAKKPYRFLRIVLTGPAADGSSVLAICGIEFYGVLYFLQSQSAKELQLK